MLRSSPGARIPCRDTARSALDGQLDEGSRTEAGGVLKPGAGNRELEGWEAREKTPDSDGVSTAASLAPRQ
jgi:hypothetical protein